MTYGSLGGHLLPGKYFIVFGLYLGFVTAVRYIETKHRSTYILISNLSSSNKHPLGFSMQCICLPCSSLKRAPIESIIKVFTISYF